MHRRRNRRSGLRGGAWGLVVATLVVGRAEAWAQCTALPDLGPAGVYAAFATTAAGSNAPSESACSVESVSITNG